MIRTERTFEAYSRGVELVRAIKGLWQLNSLRIRHGEAAGETNGRIGRFCQRWDLTIDEWHYWCKIARDV